jgi:hypothetical protein
MASIEMQSASRTDVTTGKEVWYQTLFSNTDSRNAYLKQPIETKLWKLGTTLADITTIAIAATMISERPLLGAMMDELVRRSTCF